jgi:hypothetical protein
VTYGDLMAVGPQVWGISPETAFLDIERPINAEGSIIAIARTSELDTVRLDNRRIANGSHGRRKPRGPYRKARQ